MRRTFTSHILIVLGHLLASAPLRLAHEHTTYLDTSTIGSLLGLFDEAALLFDIVIDHSFVFFTTVATLITVVASGPRSSPASW